MAIEPVNEGFEGEASMEAGGARVTVDVAFGSDGGFGDGAEWAGEEGEVSHCGGSDCLGEQKVGEWMVVFPAVGIKIALIGGYNTTAAKLLSE